MVLGDMTQMATPMQATFMSMTQEHHDMATSLPSIPIPIPLLSRIFFSGANLLFRCRNHVDSREGNGITDGIATRHPTRMRCKDPTCKYQVAQFLISSWYAGLLGIHPIPVYPEATKSRTLGDVSD